MAALVALGAAPVAKIFSTMEEGPIPAGINPGEAWLESHGRSLGHFVAGTWLKPPGRMSLECREAATGRTVAVVPAGDSSDLAAAVAAAAAAAEAWAGLGGLERGQRLTRLATTLDGDRRGTMGALLALARGRPLSRTLGADLDLGLRLLQVPAGGAQLGPPGLEGWTPLGVVAVVLAGPCSLSALLWKLGPLLAMGNTALVLCSPATAPPLLLLGELSGEGAALPPGVLNVLAGPPGLCQALRAHPEVTSVTFLGASQEELQALVWGSPCRGPRLGGPRGGRVVVIVLDSADLDSAAAAIVATAATPPALFPWGGCVVLAQDAVAAALERRLRARLGALRVGDPLDPKTEVGPLPPGTPLPEGVVQEAHEEGAQVFQVPLPPLPEGGHCFYPPTLISGAALTSCCLREPAPGPLLVLLPVRSPNEAVAVASALPQTVAAAVWAQDVTVALDTADRLPQGLVWLNALDLLDPSGGCAGGAMDTDLDEALREFGCPPWEQPPEVDEPLSPLVTADDPSDPDLAQAVAAARGAAPGWGRLPGASRARVLRGAAAALGGTHGTPKDGDSGDTDGSLRRALLRWAARAERVGGAVQEVPGGRALVTRRPLGVVGVAWGWPRPLPLELLPPALALGNCLVVAAPPGGAGPVQRLRKALVAAGLPGGALVVLPGNSRGSGSRLARQHPDGLWLCGTDAVPLLLLLAAPAPGSCCSFAFNPVSSTFRAHLNNLTPWLLLDYPVAMPSNLEPGCVRLEMVNVSQLLETLVQHLGELQGRPPHFPGCAHLRCQPGSPLGPPRDPQDPSRAAADPHLPPGPALTSLAVRHEGTLGARQGPPSPAGHGLVLLGGVGGALGLAAAAWMLWRRPCAQAGLNHWSETGMPQFPAGSPWGPHRDLLEPQRDGGARPGLRSAHKADVDTLTLTLTLLWEELGGLG
ncbi:aldehyde dehydrogenase family 16 member A1 isoform X6 [Corvus moneduloides]|uniref:aldehyde dehydrogenase family 16 member A1 isoform X6 n=1 Tax=Corvus moneduloides TaxID=1196302 RepID=UPI001364015E|nr:aldehyde dehydrogenase family 16 member A1 isoform X6 [Corvus moneduloides]